MRAPSFRLKLLLAMMLVVLGVTAAALLVTQQSVAASYRRIFAERFQSEVELFAALQEARLAAVKGKCLELAKSVRLVAAIEEQDTALLYRIALDELRELLRSGPEVPGSRRATFFRLLDGEGRVLPPTDERAGLTGASGRSGWEDQLVQVGRALRAGQEQAVGYLATEVGGRRELQEVIVTRIVDPLTARMLGALVIGFPVRGPGEASAATVTPIQSAVWFENQLYAPAMPDSLRKALARVAENVIRPRPEDEVTVTVDGVSHRVFSRVLHPESPFPPAYQVGLYSMAEPLAQQRTLGRRVLAVGTFALLLGLALSLLLSQGLSVPIRALVAATGQIRRGNLEVRVPARGQGEIAKLTISFNEMAEGLALKEKYRSVLDLVADRGVAQQLLDGEITLGGELRETSVLFCDICGFTPLSEKIDPPAVIQLLNEHMTALTRVVYENHGVVDKFVGDALMALFGAPRSSGEDAYHAVRAAWRMIEERERLNAAAGQAIAIHIGIASGTVIAGCMGSVDRLNYTVLGERVNLAARLCAQAGPMEVLLDDTTWRRVAPLIGVEALPEMQLKGISVPVAAYRLTDLRARARPA